MSAASLPTPDSAARRGRPRALLVALALYFVLIALAGALMRSGLAALAVVVLGAGVLWPALRRGHTAAWAGLAACAALALWCALQGAGWLLVDALPVLVNLGLCALFARTLRRARQPLIARFIAILEGPARAAEPRVARYARALTLAWALVLGLQGLLLGMIVLAMPQGVFDALALPGPRLAAPGWRWYLHVGSYGVVGAFLVLEYGYRRWHLRGLAHPSLPAFLLALVRQWPALLRSLGEPASRGRP